MSFENIPSQQEETPEQIAKNLASQYWTERTEERHKKMKDRNITVHGGDFDDARSESYLRNIREGKFFGGVEFSGMYDGKPSHAAEESVYNFFKGIADTVQQRMDVFQRDPKLLEEIKKEGEKAQKIVEALEKLK